MKHAFDLPPIDNPDVAVTHDQLRATRFLGCDESPILKGHIVGFQELGLSDAEISGIMPGYPALESSSLTRQQARHLEGAAFATALILRAARDYAPVLETLRAPQQELGGISLLGSFWSDLRQTRTVAYGVYQSIFEAEAEAAGYVPPQPPRIDIVDDVSPPDDPDKL